MIFSANDIIGLFGKFYTSRLRWFLCFVLLHNFLCNFLLIPPPVSPMPLILARHPSSATSLQWMCLFWVHGELEFQPEMVVLYMSSGLRKVVLRDWWVCVARLAWARASRIGWGSRIASKRREEDREFMNFSCCVRCFWHVASLYNVYCVHTWHVAMVLQRSADFSCMIHSFFFIMMCVWGVHLKYF
jgi:hypothetical protein